MVDLVLSGMALVLVGFVVIVVAALAQGNKEGAEVKGGGVIMIGPVPIIFGSDMKWASIAIVMAIALILLAVVLSLV